MKDKYSVKKTVNRRGRAAKAPLSLDSILTTALDLMSKDGLAGLSLRKVATALDTGPASLYVYVANLEELHSLMLDRALGDVVIPTDNDGDWRQQLSKLLLSYFNVLFMLPGLGQLAMNTVAHGPNTLILTEKMLALLLESGIDATRAAWAVDTLSLHFAAIAAEQDIRRRQSNPLGAVEQTFKNLSAEEFPNLHAVHKDMFLDDGEARIRWTLEVLINGVLNTSR